MAPSVLKALHKKHDHDNAASEKKQAQLATGSASVISSVQNASREGPAENGSFSLDGILTPVPPEEAMLGLHQNDSSGSTSTSSSSSSSPSSPLVSPMSSSTLPHIPSGPASRANPPKKKHGLHLPIRSRSNSQDRRSRAVSASQASVPASASPSPSAAAPSTRPCPVHRFPSRVELRAQYNRQGQLVRAVEEFYEHDATMPCLAYGPVGSDAFGRPPPYM